MLEQKALKERLSVTVASEFIASKVDPSFHPMGKLQVSNEQQQFAKEIKRIRSKSKDQHVLIVDSISFLEGRFASDLNGLLESLSQMVIQTQYNGDAVLFLLNSYSSLRARILSMTEKHVRVMMKDRAALLMGERPATEAYVMQPDNSNPLLPELTKVV